MEALLAESIGSMTEAQKNKFFFRRTKGMSVETQVNLAKEVLVSESRQPIRRNNGACGPVDEAEYSEEKSEAMLLEGLRKARPQSFERYDKVITEPTTAFAALTGSQKKEFEFCKMLGMSEADALKVANTITD